jgi:hypothetical protein
MFLGGSGLLRVNFGTGAIRLDAPLTPAPASFRLMRTA